MNSTFRVFAMLLVAGGAGYLLQSCGGSSLGGGHGDSGPPSDGGTGGAPAQGGGGVPGGSDTFGVTGDALEGAGGATVVSCGEPGAQCCDGSGRDRCQAGNACSTPSGEGVCAVTPDASIQPDGPVVGTGGMSGTGGKVGTGGKLGTGGIVNAGGAVATGGKVATGGIVGTGGIVSTGGTATGGSATGGSATGGSATGGSATGGSATAGSTSSACVAGPSPTGGTQHCNSNGSGSYGGYQWSFWENGSSGCITTYTKGAFGASWNNSGDVLARVGLQLDASKTYDQLGTISADFAETKTGTAGAYSYIGIYGSSVNPCVEYYIVEDSYNTMPVKLGSAANMGTADIDGGTYILYKSMMTGTGSSNCSGATGWTQLSSVRQTARQCGHISISQHFAAWANKGMTLGKMEECKILIEAGGGTGRIDFTTATMTAQ